MRHLARKIFFLFFFFLLLSVISASFARAADLNVNCVSSGCDSSPSNVSLFNVSNWSPGETERRTIEVKNQTGDDCSFGIKLKNISSRPTDFASKISTIISKPNGEIFNNSLEALFNLGSLFFETIGNGQTRTYQWLAAFSPLAGNEYQNAKSSFDFDLNFSCGLPPGPTATPVLGCSDVKPGAPTNFQAVSGPNADQVTLSWTSPAPPFTYFLVAYSDSPDWPPKWGNPDVGTGNSYIVSGLGSGTYFFWLRAGNGCSTGDFTGPISASALGTGGVAEGFYPGILGVKTEITPTPTGGQLGGGIFTSAGEVAGAQIKPICPFWWIVLIGQTILLSIYYGKFLKRKSLRYWWLGTIVIWGLSFSLDRLAHTYWYSPSRFCQWTPFTGAALALLETYVFRKRVLIN